MRIVIPFEEHRHLSLLSAHFTIYMYIRMKTKSKTIVWRSFYENLKGQEICTLDEIACTYMYFNSFIITN